VHPLHQVGIDLLQVLLDFVVELFESTWRASTFQLNRPG
jgi:hypothetical protein